MTFSTSNGCLLQGKALITLYGESESCSLKVTRKGVGTQEPGLLWEMDDSDGGRYFCENPAFQLPSPDSPTPDSEEKSHQRGCYVRKPQTGCFNICGGTTRNCHFPYCPLCSLRGRHYPRMSMKTRGPERLTASASSQCRSKGLMPVSQL